MQADEYLASLTPYKKPLEAIVNSNDLPFYSALSKPTPGCEL
jgi:hypothetical protein